MTSDTGNSEQGSEKPSGDKNVIRLDQHKERLKFAEVAAPAQTDGQFTAQWANDGRSVNVKGHCPACDGLTSTDFPIGIGGTRSLLRPRPRPAQLPSPVTIYCDCGHAHDDRPPDAIDTGCGRYWAVHLTDAERRPQP